MIDIDDTGMSDGVIKELENLGRMTVEVGVQGEADSFMTMLATVHEFGTEIEVTKKMRGYLGANGMHLKKTTTHIVIPERSYLRSSFDENADFFEEYIKLLVTKMIEGDIKAYNVLENFGIVAVKKVKDKIRELDSPKKHPFTLAKNPGKTNPLIQTGRFIGSISSEVKR